VTAIERALALARNRALTAADTWERHLVVAELAGSPRQVVDVGGLPGQLSSFLPGACVVAANIAAPADLLVDPGALPFRDRSIEVVTSLDALEHVPPAERRGFVAELVRVTGRRLVLCCPLGTPEHAQAEREIQAWYRELTGEDHPWLVQHLEHGLPTERELQDWLAAASEPGDRWMLRYHGDFRTTNEQFKRIVTARRRPTPTTVWGFASRRLRHHPDTRLQDRPGRHTNRIFAVVDRPAR
jgi:hypothetical protein